MDHRSVGLNNLDLANVISKSSQNNGIGQQITAENWQEDLVEENRDFASDFYYRILLYVTRN